ncbi:MAG: UDP-N-acetylglucosamine pyrophosphorylase [Clostridia bacterium]|nr:UDP-N-acetylglucosamine pyrophosphorylase [Clostridia bacterium]
MPVTVDHLFDLSHTLAATYLAALTYPWEALRSLEAWILHLGEHLPLGEYEQIQPDVWIHKTARIAPTAAISGPCIIGAETEVRHGAYIRKNALVGQGCVVGNSVEIKNAILFDGVQVPHYNYVGDSILGYRAHLGAGAITSNVKADRSPVVVHHGEENIPTGLKKLGAMLGDYAEIGCNSVLNPGTVIGRNTTVYPLSCVRGCVAAESIYKKDGVVVKKE